jgi:choline kinase
MVIGTKGECWQQAAYEAIRAHAVDLVFNFENDRNHNVYSMWLALRDLEPEDVLLLDGDLVFDEPLLRKLVTSPHEHVLVTSFAEAESTPGTRVVVSDGGTVVELGKRIAPRVFPWQIHSGMLKIGKRGFRDFVACLAEPQNLRGELEGAVSSFIRHHDVHTLCDEARAWANVNTARDLVHARALVGASNDAQLGI